MSSKVNQYEQSIRLHGNDVGDQAQNCSDQAAKLEVNETSEQINSNPHHISLRSKAEKDIVFDSEQKMLLLHMCEQITSNGEIDCSPYSIAQLKGLRSLNLASCNRVTDVSLKYAFDFVELEALSLSKCQQITAKGFECAVLKCPSIKVLNISDCHNLCDRAIEIISAHLKRLTYLHIERCSQLTDFSLDSLAMNCKCLKYLDVRGCRSMCAEPSSKLDGLRSLQQVLMSKPGPYISNNGKQPIPIPPIGF